MQKGERAILRCREDYAYGKRGKGSIPADATLTFDVELIDFGPKKKEKWEMSDDEKVAEGSASKEKGSLAFKAENFAEAARLYEDGAEMVEEVDSAQDLWVTCQLNAAMVRTPRTHHISPVHNGSQICFLPCTGVLEDGELPWGCRARGPGIEQGSLQCEGLVPSWSGA